MALTQVQQELLGGSAGRVSFFAMSSAPAGWLKANGAAISRTAYATLFAAIGTTYGSGDGSTTFNIPDMRGEFPRGYDDGRGVDSGRSLGSSQTDAFQGHFHRIAWIDDSTSQAGMQGGIYGQDYANFNYANPGTRPMRATAELANASHGTPRTAAETRPRNVALLACIKY